MFNELPLHDAEKEIDMTGWSEGIRLFYCDYKVFQYFQARGSALSVRTTLITHTYTPVAIPLHIISYKKYILFFSCTVIFMICNSTFYDEYVFLMWNHQLFFFMVNIITASLEEKILCPLGSQSWAVSGIRSKQCKGWLS